MLYDWVSPLPYAVEPPRVLTTVYGEVLLEFLNPAADGFGAGRGSRGGEPVRDHTDDEGKAKNAITQPRPDEKAVMHG